MTRNFQNKAKGREILRNTVLRRNFRDGAKARWRGVKNKRGVSMIFAIILMVALMLISAGVNEVTRRNLTKVGDIWASLQAQSAANSAFAEALVYLDDNCEVGCDYSDEYVLDADVIYGDYEIEGLSGLGGDGKYYVPIPGRGDAGEDCDPDAPGDANDDCSWNRIGYGETVEIPLYVDGEVTSDVTELYVKIRTPECEGGGDCSLNDRKLIACADGTATETRNDCAFDDDLVVMTWQIWGERDGGSDFLEGHEEKAGFGGKRSDNDSEIYTTHINSFLDDDYVVLDIDDIYDDSYETIFAVLTDGADPMVEPVLRLSFVQTISNSDGAIPYLEYQVVTDEPISSDRSFISVIGYTVSKGDTYFWPKEGSYSQYSSSPINFVFQN